MQSAKFIPKFMFQGAVAKPWYNAEKEVIFDGKIGIFPFVKKEPALRSSKYRKKGEMVTKVIDPINRDVSRWMLIEKVIPTIMEKWPHTGQHNTIYIQQDNAKAHITQDDAVWKEHCEQPGFTFILTQQPPNSPDMNVLDLGFFRSIQSLQHKKMAKTPDQLIKAVEDAFSELPHNRLFKVWVTLCHTMNQILKSKGSNRFQPPHVNKDRLEREGRLKDPIEAPMWAVIGAWERVYMDKPDSNDEQDTEEVNIDNTQAIEEHNTQERPNTEAYRPVMVNDHEASTSNANAE
ncbi:uncharacterized protein LOC110718029 [Chenopodium quinoa]|uniref:uncharacterized protein LOC110718029 n=1 Tax=Chenopodium quinoa TaxID=63459 RepID=UPI000B798C2C|nr:uncharacterized protein LOC110718029 [Chenopodium quinoa]